MLADEIIKMRFYSQDSVSGWDYLKLAVSNLQICLVNRLKHLLDPVS